MSNANDFVIENGVLVKYKGKGGAVVVPDGVTKIGAKAFYKKSKITSVVVPDGVVKIGEEAFRDCSGLESVELSDSVKIIGDQAFWGCASLQRMKAAPDVTVGRGVSQNCKRLADENGFVIIGTTLCGYYGYAEELVLPAGITKITADSLAGKLYKNEHGYWVSLPIRERITSVVLPPSITSIGDSAFGGCGKLAQIEIPNGVKVIGASTFRGCSDLSNVVLPPSVTSIGDSAFCGCGKLAQVEIPETVTRIEEETFLWCESLTEVVIPQNVTYIGPSAFGYCEKLKRVTILSPDCKIDNYVFNYAVVPVYIQNISTLPVDVRPGAAVAFAQDGGSREDPRYENHCKYIKSNAVKLMDLAIKYPELLALMCRETLISAKDIDAFIEEVQYCSQKTELTAMLLDYKHNKLTKKQRKTAVAKKEQKENEVLDRKVARQNKEGIDGLNFVVTGNLSTFKNRTEMKTFIESKGGKLLSSITPKVDYLIRNYSDDSEKESKALELEIDIIDEYRFNELAGRVFELDKNGVLLSYYGGKDAVILQGVTKIAISAFNKCFRLETVTIPDSVCEIECFAFYTCPDLRQVNIPGSVKKIGERAFADCRNLTKIRIPGSISVICEGMFSGCSNLDSVIIEEGITEISHSVFDWCEKLKEIHMPGSVVQIDPHIFFGRWDLENITIYAPAGSYAETYAKENNIPFVAE